jgi:ABC-type transport system involved in multi-copper enzyme maturation permease subunit
LAFFALASTFSVLAIHSRANTSMPPWVNALQVSIGLLFLSVIAATPLAEERVRGSLDVLLATPMAKAQIVFGKWLGTYRFVPRLAILPVLVVLGIAAPETDWLTALAMAAFVLAAGAAVTSLGLAMATWCPRLGRAVGLTVSLYLLAAVGWFFAIFAIGDSPAWASLMMGSPFFWPGAVTEGVVRYAVNDRLPAAIAWTLVYALAALVLLAATLSTFDRCLRSGCKTVMRAAN